MKYDLIKKQIYKLLFSFGGGALTGGVFFAVLYLVGVFDKGEIPMDFFSATLFGLSAGLMTSVFFFVSFLVVMWNKSVNHYFLAVSSGIYFFLYLALTSWIDSQAFVPQVRWLCVWALAIILCILLFRSPLSRLISKQGNNVNRDSTI